MGEARHFLLPTLLVQFPTGNFDRLGNVETLVFEEDSIDFVRMEVALKPQEMRKQIQRPHVVAS